MQESSADIVLQKNDFFRISLRCPAITAFPKSIHIVIQFMPPIGKMQVFFKVFKTKANTNKLNSAMIQIHIHLQSQFTERNQRIKKNVVDFAEHIFKYWKYNLSYTQIVLSEPFNYPGFKLQSVDAIGFEFSKVFPEYNNKTIYFKFSELEFNNNIVQIQFTRSLFPSYGYAFQKGDYYKNPRLAFLQDCSTNYKLPDILTYIEKNFTIGFTLYTLHCFPKLLEDETNREKFQMIRQKTYTPNKLLQQVEVKRKQFARRVAPSLIITTVGKTMNYFTVQIQNEQRFTFNITIDRKPVNEKDKKQTILRVFMKCMYSEEASFKKLFQKLEPYCGKIHFKFQQNNREVTINMEYKSRLAFEILLLSMEILWFKIIDRRSTVKRVQNSKSDLMIEQLEKNIIEVIYGGFYMRFIVKQNEEYQMEYLRTDYTKDKLPALRAETKDSNFSSLIPQNGKSGSQRQETKQIRKPLFDYYKGLRNYINFVLNSWTTKQYPELSKICDFCSRTDLSEIVRGLLNKVIDAVNHQNSKNSYIIKISVDKEQKDRRESGFNIVLRKYDTSIQNMPHKALKLTLNYDKQDTTRLDIQGTNKSTYLKTETYHPELSF